MALHLIESDVDVDALIRWASRNHGNKRQLDIGYSLHCLITSMYGSAALQPFRYLRKREAPTATLMGYSALDASSLDELSQLAAAPSALNVIQNLRSKAMPEKISLGKRIGFDLRVRPTRRRTVEGIRHERDAFTSLHDDPHKPEIVDRTQCYLDWVEEHLKKNGAALERDATSIRSVLLSTVVRDQKQQRSNNKHKLPDVIVQGNLEVADELKFNEAVMTGIGRHKAYGYGMLLFRPVNGKASC